jgi:hypothetical protein
MPSGVAIAPDRRNAIVKDALPKLASGMPTNSIAAEHGIDGSTLRRWILTMPEAEQARTDYIAGELVNAYESQKAAREAGDHDAARSAAAEFKSAAWLAERRLSTLFGAKSEVNHGVQIAVTINNPALPGRQTLTIDQDE